MRVGEKKKKKEKKRREKESERRDEKNRLVKGEQFTMSSGAKTNSGTRGRGRM